MKNNISGCILALFVLIFLCILLSSCDVVKCYPQFNLDDEYIGIKCGGDW